MFRLFVLLSIASLSFGAKCRNGQQITARGVSQSDKNEIVMVHNQFRNDISNGRVPDQPQGINLKPMVYDDQLGKKAEIVSNTCKMEHITVTDDRFWWVGQNIYSEWKSWQSGQNWTAAVTSWFSENKDFTYPDRTAAGKVTGHYTQVVWADSTSVGCDYVQYLDNVRGRTMYASLYTCNYGPGGNIIGEAPYKRG